MRLALFQPDQAGNVGAAMRLTACLGVSLDVIEPCGFPVGRAGDAQAGMDYAEIANVTRHADWDAFLAGSAVPVGASYYRWRCEAPEARFQIGDTL